MFVCNATINKTSIVVKFEFSQRWKMLLLNINEAILLGI